MQLSRPLDAIDRKIVALLQERAKRTFADIGADVGLSATAVKRRVDRLEGDGVITGYGARVNWRALGEAIESLIEIYCADRTSPGDVGRSLAICCGKLGLRFILAAPDGYGFDEPFLQLYQQRLPQGQLLLNGKPDHAVRHADAIYTDVWTSMGQEAEREHRSNSFAAYQVNEALVTHAPPHARVMHCLPAHRGEEITSEVLDGTRSVVIQQAGNRLHAQKALLQWLLT